MEQRTLGRSGLRVSLVGLGCNNFGGRIDLDASRKVIHRAIDVGITLFDTADIYGNRGGSETIIGQVLGEKRKDIVLATKFAMPMTDHAPPSSASRGYIMGAVEASLIRLRTDWIDLYQVHKPDPTTPIEETMRALEDLVTSGKVRYLGCSNFAAWQAVDAQWTARHLGTNGFVSAQDEYSLLVRQPETWLFPAFAEHGLGFLPYFPLAGGLLTGKYRSGQPLPEGARLTVQGTNRFLNDANLAVVDQLIAFAEARGHTLLDLAFSWLASRPIVSSVIAGATKPEQVDGNVNAVGWKLTHEEMVEVDRLTATH